MVGRLMKWNVALAAICWVGTLSAAEHRASNPGEVAKAVKKAVPGDVITLADGTWKSADLLFDAQGTAEQPIVLRAATPGRVVLSGTPRLRIAGSHLVVEGLYFFNAFNPDGLVTFQRDSKNQAHHCRLTQCGILDCNPAAEETPNYWVSMHGTHNRVDHCFFEGKACIGSTVVVWLPPEGEPNEHQIDHNYFGPTDAFDKRHANEAIRIGDPRTCGQTSRTFVESNIFDRCGSSVEVISNRSCENVFRDNTFLRCLGGLSLRYGNRCLVVHNFFLGAGAENAGGVRILGEQHIVANNYFDQLQGTDAQAALSLMDGTDDPQTSSFFPVRGAMVADNVLVHCNQSIVLGFADRTITKKRSSGARVPPQDCTFNGNVVVAGNGPIVQQRSEPQQLKWNGNVFSGADLGLDALPGSWAPANIAIGLRGNIRWPQHPLARGPQMPPVSLAEVGPPWYTILPKASQ
jgi:poly(beta-D-mannuronate) lyase